MPMILVGSNILERNDGEVFKLLKGNSKCN